MLPFAKQLPQPPRNYKKVDNLAESARFLNQSVSYSCEDIGYPLERRIIFKVNSGDLVDFHCTTSRHLILYHMNSSDIAYLNSLLYDLIMKKKMEDGGLNHGVVHYLSESSSTQDFSNPQVFPFDTKTRLFNRFSESIDRCDYIHNCKGRLALAISGIAMLDERHMALMASVYQAKIEEDMDAKHTPNADCIFD